MFSCKDEGEHSEGRWQSLHRLIALGAHLSPGLPVPPPLSKGKAQMALTTALTPLFVFSVTKGPEAIADICLLWPVDRCLMQRNIQLLNSSKQE